MSTGGAVDAEIRWFTSSFSGGSDGGCVEVAFLPDGAVGVRDTKDRALAPHRYTAARWDAFTAAVRSGAFAGRA
jgi:hypothetical protein